MIAFVFPGQGAQFSGMGRELLDDFPEEVAMADGVLGRSVRDLCALDDAALRETENTQPALFFVNALHLLWMHRLGVRPDLAAGHSLGELNALVAAGVLDLESGLRIADQRGRAMADAAADQSFRGGMVAATHLANHADLDALLTAEFPDFDRASLNSPGQVSLSGPAARTQELRARIEELGLGRAAVLNVGCAFHSRYMADAAATFEAWLSGASVAIRPGRAPVYSCATAEPFPADRQQIVDLMVRQIVSPIRWMDTVRAMAENGPVLYHELGPRSVVTALVRESVVSPQPAEAMAG